VSVNICCGPELIYYIDALLLVQLSSSRKTSVYFVDDVFIKMLGYSLINPNLKTVFLSTDTSVKFPSNYILQIRDEIMWKS